MYYESRKCQQNLINFNTIVQQDLDKYKKNTDPIWVKEITAALKKNRKIMELLVPKDTGKIKISQQKLLAKGFNFGYHTHTYTTKVGSNYSFCYEYGYLKIDNENYMLVKRATD